MDQSEDFVQTLLNMGFPNESEVRRALRLGKGDLNEAVSILTNESPGMHYDTLDDLDVEMKDVQKVAKPVIFGPSLPPSYDEVVETSGEDTTIPLHVEILNDDAPADENFEFPVTNLYELEGRVFTDSWSIPYKKDESLGKCLVAATKLAKKGMTESDEHCRRFLEHCLPECIKKLTTAGAVHRWGADIQEGVFSMLQLLVDLACARLAYQPVHLDVMNCLAMTFLPEGEFHYKNRQRKPELIYWNDIFGIDGVFAISPGYNTYKDPYGWLTNIINRFAYKDGFKYVMENMLHPDIDAPSMAAVLGPFGPCAEYLNPKVVHAFLVPAVERVVKYVNELTDEDFKEKKVGTVCELLATIKLICISLWPDDISNVDNLRLNVVLRMLKAPHFNARMNALKEVTKLIEDSTSTKVSRIAIAPDGILDWLDENNVLSVALEGNIDQAQYCDKVKGMVDFLGSRLSQEELDTIWGMQNGQTNQVTDNIHSIVSVAAAKFNTDQLEHLFLLVQKSWIVENDCVREKLLSLIGRIGRESKAAKAIIKVLDVLWELAHIPELSTLLLEQALGEHMTILSDNYIVKEATKKSFVIKCVDDIKKGSWVLPALKHLLNISVNITKSTFQKDRGFMHDLQRNYDIVKLVTNSLMKCHMKSVNTASTNGTSDPRHLVDGRYTHKEFMLKHLQFLQFILDKGTLYLVWHRARDIWETLVSNTQASDWDRETCFEWFTKGISDLEPDTQECLFTKELLTLNPSKVSQKGFTCFRAYFESVNGSQHKLKKQQGTITVEKLDLTGINYLWELCLNTNNEEIAADAIELLITCSFTGLATRLKKDVVSLHKKFIDDCYNRLEAAIISLGGSAIFQVLSNATRTLTAAIVPNAASVPLPVRSLHLMNIERLLLIAERYVVTVEELHSTQRTILPHGASYQGNPVNMYITCDSPKQDILVVSHGNETLASARSKIAEQLSCKADQIQIAANEKMLPMSKDQKLLNQLEFDDDQMLSVRIITTGGGTSTSQLKQEPSTTRSSYDLEQEKMLPGPVMAVDGPVFDMLYQLADIEEPKITARVRSLLTLIPTDPSVLDDLESISTRSYRQSSPDDISPRSSPRASSPKKWVIVPPSPGTPRQQTPREILKKLFDSSASDMSTFRVLYNLEVLSSKLMPTITDAVILDSCKTFCEDFLNAGGLNIVVNVLQKDAIPLEVEYITRQGCYAISLQLARFLLCGQTVMGEAPQAPSLLRIRRESTASIESSNSLSLCTSPTAASRAVQTMGVQDFTETVACFLRVTWAAAAGKLHLAGSAQPIKESVHTYGGSGRSSRQSSTSSTTSTSSENEVQCLHAGICVNQKQVTNKDSIIAREALELLVTCLQLRDSLLASFYSLPFVGDFIIEVLVGCTVSEVRDAARDQLYILSQTEVPKTKSVIMQTPHQFLLQVLLRARLPFWATSCLVRSSGQRLLKQCTQYFELRCKLLEKLSSEDQNTLEIDINSMIEDELAWLSNFQTSNIKELADVENKLLKAHLDLITTLFTCEGVEKHIQGKELVSDLLNEFLFPACKMISGDNSQLSGSLVDFNPKCREPESRVAAYQLLEELADKSMENLDDICNELIQSHHLGNLETTNEWEFMPPVDSRASCSFVGLKNAGATCYMNSVIQNLYMTPGVPDYILGVGEGDDLTVDEESVFYQIQQVFGNLLDSKLQYYVPEKFWKVFKLWGQTVNVREQQDAFDFFTALIDQLDEHLKKNGRDQIFKKKFQGIFSDQKICEGCPHRYEREEVFYALNLTVKNATLQDSLAQFVKGELLEGDNAYFCEKCGEKRNTTKRMCIKMLPPLLCIQLKRFDYDWEANRALKYDDYFKFPWVLDMEPYTADGMARREATVDTSSTEIGDGEPSSRVDGEMFTGGVIRSNQINYELVGIIVHSGQANAGHYYSYIKDRRGDSMSNPSRGHWFKFNDTTVEECEMTDIVLEDECFGGTYKAKVYDQSSSYPEERTRYWNGYLLYYEKVELMRTPMSAKKGKLGRARRQIQAGPERDSLIELTELVHKGESKGLFMDKMPARIQQHVREENLRFMKNRDVYNTDYFKFVLNLVAKNTHHIHHEHYSKMCLQSLRLGVFFLFNTYFRTKKKLRQDIGEWVAAIENIVQRCKEACMWFVDYMAHESGKTYIKPFILECPTKEVRLGFARILERTICSYFRHGGVTTQKSFNELIENILQMLNKDVPDNCKTCTQYFWLISVYVELGTKACAHMFLRNGFPRIVNFLLGPAVSQQDPSIRRWSSIQAREFGPLHTTLATLILNSNVQSFWTEDPHNHKPYQSDSIKPQILLKMSNSMQKIVFGEESIRYVREVIMAIKEVNTSISVLSDMLLYCSFSNNTFSMVVLTHIMAQYVCSPVIELKSLFSLLLEILMLEDEIQLKRIKCVIDGYKEDKAEYEGLLAVIKASQLTDSRRSYQCIKFVVTLSNKCNVAKEYLIQTPTKWLWAINWLKKKMSDHQSVPHWSVVTPVVSNEDSNSKTFQRTVSAQDTLNEATALLTELEAQEGNNLEMDTNNHSSSDSQSNRDSNGDDETKSNSEQMDEVDSNSVPHPKINKDDILT